MEQATLTQPGPIPTRARQHHLLIMAYYTLMALLLTYPWVTHFTTHFPGDGGDGYLFIWDFWYFKQQVLQLKNPFFTNDFFFPIGASLFFQNNTLITNVLALILFLFSSNIALVSNCVILFTSFTLSGYFVFRLVDDLTHNKWAALFAGTLFAFCPYKLARMLGHFELTSTYWIPLFIWVFLKMTDPKGSYRHAVLAGIIATLTMLDVYYYSVFLIFFVLLFYTYKFFDREQRPEYLGWPGIKKALVMGGASFLTAAPFLVTAYRHAQAGYYDKVENWLGANEYVSDATAFFVPSFLHPFWRPYVMEYYQRLYTIEGVVFFGWVVLLLTLFATLYLTRQRPELRLWRFMLIAFVILSLGPMLHVRGKYTFDFDGLEVSMPLPFLLVHYIPLLGHIRCPSRLSIVAMLCAAVLSAYTWMWIQEKMQRQPSAIGVVFTLLIIAGLLEYLSVPYPLCSAYVPVVFEKIAEDKNPGTVLELPLGIFDGAFGRGSNDLGSFWTYAQIVHGKKRIGGYTGRGVHKPLDYFEKFPVLHRLLDIEENKAAAPENLDEERKSAADLIQQTSLKYIVVHPIYRDTPSHQYILAVFNLRDPLYENEDYLVYQVSAENIPPPKESTDGREPQLVH